MGVVRVSVRRCLRAFPAVLALSALQWGLLVAGTHQRPVHAQTPGPPNIILIVTDDQRFDTLQVMPEVRRLLVARGMTLRRAIVSNPLCCPSRATIFTGRYSHTTGVYTNLAPDGGWPLFQPSESDTIATALNAVGYRTGLFGKYMNGYGGAGAYVPPGWDRWFATTGRTTYYNYTVYDDVKGHVSYGSRPKHYLTDVIRNKAVSFIRNAPAGEPLFLAVTPFAPHATSIAAPRHEGAFSSAPVPLGKAVNEANVSDKPAYIADQPLGLLSSVRKQTRDQWESLLAVDELVSRIMSTLAETGRSNTLVIFTSDNGRSNREHRWEGKQVPYEESIRVPMIVRLPGQIPAGTVSGALVSNVDLAPTIADFAGTSISADGLSMRPLLTDLSSSIRDSVLLEHVQQVGPEVPTYCGVRTSAFTFVHYTTGEEELYDLAKDPRQLQNVASARPNKAAQLRALTESLCQPVPPGFSW